MPGPRKALRAGLRLEQEKTPAQQDKQTDMEDRALSWASITHTTIQ